MTRLSAGAVLVVSLLGTSSLAANAAGGSSDADNPLERAAARILATATPGHPLKVVVTTHTASGPRITAVTVGSAARALALITAGLSRSTTIGVDMAHPVHLDVSNDTYRSRQWPLTRFGAESLWRTSTGSGVTVAVVDTGVLGTHPDLRGKVYSGHDFIDPGTSATDQNGHGTHVAGIIAATADNKRGIAGLARSAKILPVRVLDAKGEGDSATVAQGIVWAAKHGADVINLSLGSPLSDSAGRAAVAYAISRNVLVVAAAGNDGCGLLGSPPSYPAAYPGVVGVGAIDQQGAIASYSNCGTYVDVVAPGSEVLSTMIARPDASLGCSPTWTYCTLSGTSMATPYTAAAAALEIAREGTGWRQSAVAARLSATADDIGWAGRDDRSGSGIINPRRLLAGR